MDKKEKILIACLAVGFTAFFCAVAIATSYSTKSNSKESDSSDFVSESFVTKPITTAQSDLTTTEYEVLSYSGDNELFGDGDIWEIKSISSNDNVLFVLPNDTAVVSPEGQKEELHYSYAVNESQVVPLTTYRDGESVILFAANGIYATPQVSEIWVVSTDDETSVLAWKAD